MHLSSLVFDMIIAVYWDVKLHIIETNKHIFEVLYIGPRPVFYISDTSVLVLNVLCFRVDFLCCLSLMYVN